MQKKKTLLEFLPLHNVSTLTTITTLIVLLKWKTISFTSINVEQAHYCELEVFEAHPSDILFP